MSQMAVQLKQTGAQRYVMYYKNGVTAVTGTYTVADGDFFVTGDGTFTITMPTAVGKAGHHYHFKNIGSGTVTLDGLGAETIDNAATLVLAQHESAHLISDNVEWWDI